ncbi:MAG: L,D-transpeptidase [Nannocystaceae bacterium]|nr:L,D-transpeptidase [Nannocystaceae bacterium]
MATAMIVGALGLTRLLTALTGLEPTALAREGEVTVAPTEVRFIEARHAETVVRGRPWVPHKRIATVAGGTRFAVRGVVESRDDNGCHGKPWYAIHPFGFVCSEHAKLADAPPEAGVALPALPGRRLPHSYALVRHDGVPEYGSMADARAGLVRRELTKGMSLVIRKSVDVDGAEYVETQHGALVPREGVGWMGQGSAWAGFVLDDATVGPRFAWTNAERTVVRDGPASDAAKLRTLGRREIVSLLEPNSLTDTRFWRIGEGEWIAATELNEVHVIPPPEGVATEARVRETGNDQWIDVDIGEQVLVAYRGDVPVFATLVSTGKSSPTPLGNYPIWAKVASMDMANQDWEDNAFLVQGVPWVMLFQGHNAIHGAYWHDRFGNRRSHGCVNVAPLDAKWLFDWVGPALPRGWTGYLPSSLEHAPVVHVRDSSRPQGLQFTQSRPIGPPDAEEERRKTEAAQKRRAEKAALDAELEVGTPLWPEGGDAP